ncbi:MAG: hypothetical protein QCI82_11235 [Candidatus Thermoplasmatota archaeon]|nr:hypothetical protein [Candidatus Thermoplasmatota archaeon]
MYNGTHLLAGMDSIYEINENNKLPTIFLILGVISTIIFIIIILVLAVMIINKYRHFKNYLPKEKINDKKEEKSKYVS